jgi:hypothetical protein
MHSHIGWFDFDAVPHEIGDEIINLMEKLNSSEIFKEKWTHFSKLRWLDRKQDFA